MVKASVLETEFCEFESRSPHMPRTDKERAQEKRSIVSSYKTKIGCKDCGYDIHPAVLEFDHVKNSGLPNTGKQRTVASLMYRRWSVIWEEINKCEVVCANCHAVRTHKRRMVAEV